VLELIWALVALAALVRPRRGPAPA
jgi:hypothetical protein